MLLKNGQNRGGIGWTIHARRRHLDEEHLNPGGFGHDQGAPRCSTHVEKSVRYIVWGEKSSAGCSPDPPIANLEQELTLQYVEPFVLTMMHV